MNGLRNDKWDEGEIGIHFVDIVAFSLVDTIVDLGGALGAMIVDMLGEALGNGLGGIGGIAVDDDDLDRCIGLAGYRFETSVEGSGRIASRNDDGYKGVTGHTGLVYQICWKVAKRLRWFDIAIIRLIWFNMSGLLINPISP